MSDFKELLQQQLDVCRRFGSEFVTAPNEKKVGLAIKTMAKSPIFGVRLPVTHDTTGWYIHAGESSKDADFYPPCALRTL